MGTLAVAERDALLDAFKETPAWVKLHTGAPGSAGTENAATEATRKQATIGAASNGASTNTAALEWTDVSTTETVTHVSLWTAESGGTFRGSDDLSEPAELKEGDTLKISAGDLDFSAT